MQVLRIPAALHDVFGESQSAFNLVAIFAGCAILSAAFWKGLAVDSMTALPPWYRLAPAFLLVLDIAAGCIANFTEGTSNFYARRPRLRWIFIAIHWHLPVCAALLGWPLPIFLAYWLYTIAGACVVNMRIGKPDQPVVAGLLLAAGLCLIMLSGFPSSVPAGAARIVSALFMVKVQFAFAVDHYRVCPPGASGD